MLAVCGLLGWLVMGLLRIDRGLARLEATFFSCCVGTSAVSLYTLGVGLSGGLHARWLFLAPAGVVTAAAIFRLWRLRQALALPGAVREGSRAGDRLVGGSHAHDSLATSTAAEAANARRWLCWALPFSLAIVLAGTLPPVDFDVREYHLQVPKEFYLAGRIGFLPHNVYGNMPLGTEMLSLAAIAAVGDWWTGGARGQNRNCLVRAIDSAGVAGGWAAVAESAPRRCRGAGLHFDTLGRECLVVGSH